MYSIRGLGFMYTNKPRIGAFLAAMEKAIGPDSVVLDLGAGSGIFALLACKMGAKRVYAIEPNPAIHLLDESASANGFEDRIQTYQGLSSEVALPEKVDMIIHDIGGGLPYYMGSIETIIDARQRFLKPSGSFLPEADRLRAVVLSSRECFEALVEPWGEDTLGLDLRAGRSLALNAWGFFPDKAYDCLSDVVTIKAIDYLTEIEANLDTSCVWSVKREGEAHGIAVYYDRTFAPGVEASNAFDAAAPHDISSFYGRAFFPWERPVHLQVGDRVSFKLRADLIGSDYVWTWTSDVRRPSSENESIALFKQSTALGQPLSPLQLKKMRASHIPQLNEQAQIDLAALEMMSSKMSNGEIAAVLQQRFSDNFSGNNEALTYLGEMAIRYSD